jgi:cation diffusion facilitator family transporter
VNNEQDKARIAQKVTLIGAVLDTFLGLAKILVGLFANSAALVADGIHSFSDLVTDIVVVLIFRVSHKAPDETHPWGHQRFETIGTVLLGGILMAVAGAMAFESLRLLFEEKTSQIPGWAALVVAILSIGSKEWIYRYTLKWGKRLKSDLMIANAWHSRTDAISSIVVLVGLIGALAGYPWLDAVAAVVVAVFVGKIGWDLTYDNIKQLVDTALPAERVDAFKKTVLEIPEIINVHHFKTRLMGSQIQLEMHIQVAPYMSASEGHWVGDKAVEALLKEYDDIGHVIFHIDTYDDEEEHLCRILPLRHEIESKIAPVLSAHGVDLKHALLTLHYVNERIEIELKFSNTNTSLNLNRLKTDLNAQLVDFPWFSKLRVWNEIS